MCGHFVARRLTLISASPLALLKLGPMNISDAIRLFFRKVVRRSNPGGQVASGEQLWAMKREAQARDHELASRGEVPPESMLLLRPKMLEDARIEWSDAPLNEEADPERTPAPEKTYKTSQGPANSSD